MPSHDVEIATPDGVAGASLHLPDGAGPWPAVIMYPDAGGLRDQFREMGGRLATNGFVVLVPDVYYRAGGFEPFSMESLYRDPDERKRFGELIAPLTNEAIERDARAFVEFLDGRSETAPGPFGVTGYCMGGRMALRIAGLLGERIGAAASFHGGRLAVDDDPQSPHLLAADVRATVYVAAAENDPSFDLEQEARLRHAYETAGIDHKIEQYPAAHGFAVSDNPSYDETAAGRHWHATTSFFTRYLA